MQKQFDLNGKIALVTGAGGLLGRQHCLALAAAGATVVAADLEGEACQQFLGSSDIKGMAISLDVCDRSSIATALNNIRRRYDHLDILVNNAAINDKFEEPEHIGELSKFENYPLELWQKSVDVNLTGIFLCCQVFGADMASRGIGSIINIASTYGMVAPNQDLYQTADGRQQFYKTAAYPATKAAVLGLTRFLAAYWGEEGVRVNALSPGGVENGQEAYFVEQYAQRTPLKRMARPQDYQGALVFLASDASAYMTGANLVVDGGWTIW